jgi:cytochrome c oxidase cbb3-type subunit 3
MKLKADLTFFLATVAAAALGAGSNGAIAMEPGKLEPKLTAQATTGELKPGQKVPSSNPRSGDPDAIETGKQLYFTWCVQCHGHKANGESRFGKYAGNLTVFWRGYKEFVVIVTNGRVQNMMPPWKEVLDEENISKIGAYLETLAVEGANWQ